MSRRKRVAPDEWARLSVRWYTDPVLRAAAKQAPAALAMFPVLLALAKSSSHASKNPSGTIQITMDDLASYACCTKGRAMKALEALVDGELVSVEPDRIGMLRVTLASFASWQTPRGSNAEANEHYDANVRNSSASEFAGKSMPLPDTNPMSTRCEAGIEVEVEEKVREMSSSAKPKHDPAIIRDIFDHWVSATDRQAARVRLTATRTAKVTARLRDGYTPDQIKSAISGYAASSFHRGDNDRGHRYDSLEFICRDGEKIERGIEMRAPAAVKAAAVATATASAADEAERRWKQQRDAEAAAVARAVEAKQGRAS